MTYTTPVTLLERLRQPEQHAAWKRFVELYYPILFHWTKGAGLQVQDAEDVVQEIFLILVKKLPDFAHDDQKSFRSWLATIVRNKLIDRRRKQVVQVGQADDFLLQSLADRHDDDFFEVNTYRRHVLARALKLLEADFQPGTWKAFLDHSVDGRPAKEVAAALNMSEGAVYMAKFRVLCRLREEVRGLLD